MHLTPSWVHVRFTDPYGLFATDSDEHYDSLCDMGSVVPGTDITFRAFAAQHQGAREQELREIHREADEYARADDELNPDDDPDLTPPATPHPSAGVTPAIRKSLLPNTSGLLNEEREGSTDQSTSNLSS